jgi:P pilus assembly chaperone PapD
MTRLNTIYNFGKLNVGDEMYVPNTSSSEFKTHNGYAKRHNVKFSLRNKDGGVIIKRIA